MAYIEYRNVCVGFGSGTDRIEVLKDINLSIEKEEFVAVLGYSGAGKSTLVNLLAGLITPDSGEVLVDGKPVAGPGPERGLVFQNYSLLPWLSVYRNVELAVNEVFSHETQDKRRKRIETAIDQVNLTPAVDKLPGELSGGMRQRTSVARTLSMKPSILLLDEPLSALDALTRSVIQDQILEIWQQEKQTILLITNDVDEALYMADRIIPLGTGPAASLGCETVVDMDRPRDRRMISSDPSVQELRNEVINFLLAEKERERGRGDQSRVSLPNIRPVDISRARPSFAFGTRPKKRKTIPTS